MVTEAEASLHSLAAHLGFIAVRNNPTYPFGPTVVIHELFIEVEADKRPSTQLIVDAFRESGMLIVERYSIALAHEERQLEVFESQIPGPDGTIHLVGINVQIEHRIGFDFNWENIKKAVHMMFSPYNAFSVKARIIVDAPLAIKEFAKEDKHGRS